jgi:N-acetylmuramoyl-L-alanine amidase
MLESPVEQGAPGSGGWVRTGWVWILGVFFVAVAAVAAPAPLAAARLSDETHAVLDRSYDILLIVSPHPGDAWSRLARRLTGDGENWPAIAELNRAGSKLTTEGQIRIPLGMLKPALQREVVTSLFPCDFMTPEGWSHHVIGGDIEGESLWKIAEWFTGDGAHYAMLREANPGQALSTHKYDVILIPRRLLSAAFSGETEDANAPKTARVRKAEDDPIERAPANESHEEPAVEVVSAGQPSLSYNRTAAEPYAVYRLQKGEALYSSVAIRFTGRVYSKDVGDVVGRIVKFNGIEDVARIPIGHAVRIPMELLLPEYRPLDDPTRVAKEQARRESARMARRVEAKNLRGIQVILDAGHGGSDVGTTHGGLWESTYVYDVMCRLKSVLEKKSGATVWTTTRSKGAGFDFADDDELAETTDHIVLTSPKYVLRDPVVGVNLRWYLANSIFRRAMKKHVPAEKVVFVSIHADSLHPSLRGTMAYIPGERYVTGSFTKSDDVYLARAEVRESPTVTHSEDESLEAEGLSRDLAESIMAALDRAGLQVHPFNPVRDNVVRNGREWVPAVIRYNKVPTRLLLEVCNMGNRSDLAMMKTRRYRQKLAEAIYRGIVDFYADSDEDAGKSAVAAASK